MIVVACGDDGEFDAGVDAGGRDAGRDAARRDSGWRDVGVDARFDAGEEPAGWVPLPGFPDGCVVERAQHPEAVFRPTWLSCGDGCQYLARDPVFPHAIDENVGSHDGERGWFSIVQGDLVGRVVILLATDGTVAGAWRGPDPRARGPDDGICMVGAVAVGEGHAALSMEVGYGELPRRSFLYHAALDAIGRATVPIAILDERVLVGTNVIQQIETSATTVAAALQPEGVVLVFEGGEQRTLAGATSATPGIPQRIHVARRTVFWEDWVPPVRAAYGAMARDEAVFREAVGGDIKAFNATSAEFAWLEGYDRQPDLTYGRLELWTAPFTADAAMLEPRLVRELPVYDGGQAEAGVFAYRSYPPHRIELYDLADGRHRTWFAPEGFALFSEPIYISETEMAMSGGIDGGMSILIRVELSSIPYVD